MDRGSIPPAKPPMSIFGLRLAAFARPNRAKPAEELKQTKGRGGLEAVRIAMGSIEDEAEMRA